MEMRAKPSTKILQPTLNRDEGRVGGEADFIWLGRFLLSRCSITLHECASERQDSAQVVVRAQRNAADHI